MADSAVAPAARRRNCLRGNVIGFPLPSRCDTHPVALRPKARAEPAAPCIEIAEHLGFVGEAAQERLVLLVATHQAEVTVRNRAALEHDLDQHAYPVVMLAAMVADAEREIAQTIEQRTTLVDLDRQCIMRAVSHDDIGT